MSSSLINILIVGFIALYIIKSIFIGLTSYRQNKEHTTEEYFLGNRSISWLFLGFTMFATWMSTFAYLGAPGFYFKNGVGWLIIHGFLGIGTPFLMWFLGRKMWLLGKEKGYLTPGDMLGDLYQSKLVKVVSGLIGLVALVPYALIQLIGIGKVVEVSTGGVISFGMGIMISIVAIAFYAYFGGVRAIVWTDVIQGLIFGFVMLMGVMVVMDKTGGLSAGLLKAVELKPEIFTFKLSGIGNPITMLLIWGFGFVILPHMWQRMYMSKSRQDFSRTVLFSGVLAFTFITLPTMLIGIWSISLLPGLADTDKLLPTLFSHHFQLMLPFLVLGTFAAGMSTIDSQLLSASSLFVRDVWEPVTGQKLSPQKEEKLGKLVVLGLVFVSTLLALSPINKTSIILIASKGVGLGFMLLAPLLFCLYIKNASRKGAELALVFGVLVLLSLEFNWIDVTIPYQFGPPVVAFVLQLILLGGASIIRKAGDH